jgi:hypothetical protein
MNDLNKLGQIAYDGRVKRHTSANGALESQPGWILNSMVEGLAAVRVGATSLVSHFRQQSAAPEACAEESITYERA